MDFRAVLAFIGIAFISSLFNKNRAGSKPVEDTRQPIENRPMPPSQAPVTPRKPSMDQEEKRGLPRGLDDLFREMKREFKKHYLGDEKEGPSPPVEEAREPKRDMGTGQGGQPASIPPIRASKKIRPTVYEGEIGKEEIDIDFNKRSLIQGVIMAEILQKPKALRRWGR